MFFIYGFWVCILWVFYAFCCFSSVNEREYCWADATLRWYGNDMAIDDDPWRFISECVILYGFGASTTVKRPQKMFPFPVMSPGTESITYEVLLLSRRHNSVDG